MPTTAGRATVYASVEPVGIPDARLQKRLGARTPALTSWHVRIRLDGAGPESGALDADTVELLRQRSPLPHDGDDDMETPEPLTLTTAEILTTLADRIRRRMERGGPRGPLPDLAARLEALRSRQVATAGESVQLLKDLLQLAREVVKTDGATPGGEETAVIDQDRGALTPILQEFAPAGTPVIVERVAEDIDAIVRAVRGTGWHASTPGDREVRVQIRTVLRVHGLPASGGVFNRAYAYIAEHH